MTEKEYLKLGNPDEIKDKKIYLLLKKEIVKSLIKKGYEVPENSLLAFPREGFLSFKERNQEDKEESFYYNFSVPFESIKYQWENNDLSLRKTILKSDNEDKVFADDLKHFEKSVKKFLKQNGLYNKKEEDYDNSDR